MKDRLGQVGHGRARHRMDGERVVCETRWHTGVKLYHHQGQVLPVREAGAGEPTCGHCLDVLGRG